jgi:uncharacterized protein (DUF2237 family)
VRICYIHTQSSECEKVKIEKRKSFFSGTSETLALAIDYPYLQKILLKNVNLDKYPILKKELTMKNIFGEPLESCCTNPKTGFYRDGFCRTNQEDNGKHVVCAIVTAEFLEFSRRQGNDLSTPRPEYLFPGLQPGDKWCLCALRWKEAFEAGCAPKVVLEATDERALEYIDINNLILHAVKNI